MIHRQLSCLVAGPIFLTTALAFAADPPAAEPKEPKADVAAAGEPKKDLPASSRWQTSIYGFLEFDAMYDSTQSFSDSPVNSPLLRSDGSRPAYLPVGTDELKGPMYGASHPRMQATARNTRFGFKMSPPEFAGMKVTGVFEVDLFGNQPSNPPTTPEASFFTNAALRLRHAYAKIETDSVDVLFGQYYNLFGWQPNFFPATLSFLGTPNMIFGRTPQVRIGKLIKTHPMNIELAAAATRSPQRDSALPGLEGGLRFELNQWKGPQGRGSGQPVLSGMSIGLSGVVRKFSVNSFANNRGDITQSTDIAKAFGYGYSLDAIVPIIPSKDLENRVGSLTLTASYVKGQGIGDLYTGGLTGGATFPLPEGPGGANTGFFAGNIDPGLVQYRILPPGTVCGTAQCAELRVVKWTSAMVGFQFYLPPGGRLVLTGNYTRSKSDNLALTEDVMEQIAQGGDPARTFNTAEYFDANLFFDITPAVRTALSYQLIKQKFLNGQTSVNGGNEKNQRIELGGLFFF